MSDERLEAKKRLGEALLRAWDMGGLLSVHIPTRDARLEHAPPPKPKQPEQTDDDVTEDEDSLRAKEIATRHIEAVNESKRLDVQLAQAKATGKAAKVATAEQKANQQKWKAQALEAKAKLKGR